MNPIFEAAFEKLENTKNNFFVTGKAGTGKTTFLRYFKERSKKKIALLAPTGVAALQIGGQTIHSFFRFSLGPIKAKQVKKRVDADLYMQIETIIIDEVSMVRADMLDAIHVFLQNNRSNKIEPFGGVQIILCGDPFQLPPVVKEEAERKMIEMMFEGPHFFQSNIFNNDKFSLIHFTEIYRQKDSKFLSLLEKMRTNTMDESSFELINERYFPTWNPPDEWGFITLATTNLLVDQLNMKKLNSLSGKAQRYNAEVSGEIEINSMPAPYYLEIKIGAQVMFVMNDPDKKWVNGSIGRVLSYTDEEVTIELAKEGESQIVQTNAVEWKIFDYTFDSKKKKIIEKEKGTYKQIPIRLAWAVTIHKSQGMSFDRVFINLGTRVFAPGQAYVAFSRCRSMEGIVLARKLYPMDIFLDQSVIDFSERFNIN